MNKILFLLQLNIKKNDYPQNMKSYPKYIEQYLNHLVKWNMANGYGSKLAKLIKSKV